MKAMRLLWSGVNAVFLLALALMLAANATAAGAPPQEGTTLPDFKLNAPNRFDERAYLGIQDQSTFKVPQVRADLVVIEIFSMYCPFCQKEAPVVNELHSAVEKRQDLKGKVKIIGIGAGNSPYEVSAFKNLYAIQFPLFPDEDFALHSLLGEVRTPYFIVIRNKPGGQSKVIYSKVGSIGDPREFLEMILKKARSQ